MGSIAYVTDEKMLEYHRVCRNRTILFWRLANKRKMTDFRKGDLLFFFAKDRFSKKKGFVGYGHYDSTKRLSLKQMWNQYGQETGYESYENLHDAIEKASKGDEIPKVMNCLYLRDVVFFNAPVFPEEVGLSVAVKLESYMYLDRNDSSVTVEILKKADQMGIDTWSADPDMDPEEVFHKDEILHKMALISERIGKKNYSSRESVRLNKLIDTRIEKEGWKLLRGSATDLIRLEDDTLYISTIFVASVKNRQDSIRELFGKLSLYRLYAKQENITKEIRFEVITDDNTSEIEELVEIFNHEKL